MNNCCTICKNAKSVTYTQVGSPAVRLRLARCTAWVKQWSEAMDSPQTISNNGLSLDFASKRIFYIVHIGEVIYFKI